MTTRVSKEFHVGQNSLRGSIPKDIVNAKRLKSLDMNQNKLSGEIPQLSVVSLF